MSEFLQPLSHCEIWDSGLVTFTSSPLPSDQWVFCLNSRALHDSFSFPKGLSLWASVSIQAIRKLLTFSFCNLLVFHLTAKSLQHPIKIYLTDNIPEHSD